MYQVFCRCGKVLSVEAGSAGSVVFCTCGDIVSVPSVTELQAQATTQAASTLPLPSPEVIPADTIPRDPDPENQAASTLPLPAPEVIPADTIPRDPYPDSKASRHDFPENDPLDEAITSAALAPTAPSFTHQPGSSDEAIPGNISVGEIIAPMQASLRTERGSRRGRRVMAALTSEAIWIQDVWQILSVPLAGLGVDRGKNDKELLLTLDREGEAEKLTLAFTDAATGERWVREVRRQQQLMPNAPQRICYQPEGVSLVRRVGDVPHTVVGQVQFTGQSSWVADRGLQLLAGMRGADAVINVFRRKCPELGWGALQVTGTLVRLEDVDARKRLRLRFYADQVRTLVTRMLAFLIVQGALLFLSTVFCIGPASLQVPTGEKLSDALASAGLGLGTYFALPCVLVILLGVLRWPGLLSAAGLAVLAATTGRVLAVLVSHLLAVRITGAVLGGTEIGILLDPFNWAFMIIGVTLFGRTRCLARDARYILPEEMQAIPVARVWWTRGLFAVSAAYGLALLGFVAFTRYQDSTYLLQPGVDVRREQEGLLAMNEGLDQFNKGDLAAAERSWQRSLRAWEELTKAPSAPVSYRVNLAQTLYNLAALCERQNRPEDSEKYFERVVALTPLLEADPQVMNPQLRQTLADARRGIFARREQEALSAMNEGLDQFNKGDLAAAERSWQRSLRLWEELTKAPSAPVSYRADLAQTLYNLALLCERQNRPEDAEKYYERVVALTPLLEADPQVMSPQLRQTLAHARRALTELRGGDLNKR
jgi:tetratricopeptide (TPR) repeat protein